MRNRAFHKASWFHASTIAGFVLFYLLCGCFVTGARGQVAETEARTSTVAKVFYFSFGAYPMSSIGKTNIEERSEFKIRILTRRYFDGPSGHPFLYKLNKMLTAAPGSKPLDDHAIRLKFVFPTETFYADANGRVLRTETGELFQLSPLDMAEIDHDIEYLSGIVDMKAIQSIEEFGAKK